MLSRSVNRSRPPRRRARRRAGNRRRTPWRDLTRKILAVGLGITAVLLLLAPDDPAGDAQAQVVVAAHDLPAGTQISADDLETIEVAATEVPSHALTDVDSAEGRQVIGAVRRGEVLTDARLVGPAAFDVPAGYLPLVVPVSDPHTLITIREGDCVDIYAAYAGTPLTRVGGSALLISITDEPPGSAAGADSPTSPSPAYLVVAITHEQVTHVIEALAADIVLATLCHAWPTSADQEPEQKEQEGP